MRQPKPKTSSPTPTTEHPNARRHLPAAKARTVFAVDRTRAQITSTHYVKGRSGEPACIAVMPGGSPGHDRRQVGEGAARGRPCGGRSPRLCAASYSPRAARTACYPGQARKCRRPTASYPPGGSAGRAVVHLRLTGSLAPGARPSADLAGRMSTLPAQAGSRKPSTTRSPGAPLLVSREDEGDSAVGIARQVPEGAVRPRMSVVRCLAVDSTCWPAGAARLGPLDDTRLQQGLQARAAHKGKGLRTGAGRRIGVLAVDRGRCLT